MKLPRGFTASGVRSGVRKKRPDLAVILAEQAAAAAAIFTRNRFPAAPVVLSRAALRRSGGWIRAVVVNAGCANAITGRAGVAGAVRVRRRAAEIVGCGADEVFLASTGVIGVPLPDGRIRAALPAAVARLSSGGLEAASQAILTTDVGPKVASGTFRRGGRSGRIVGFAKGAGMIHPDMATMLAFVMTDAPAEPAFLQAALRRAAADTFNAISVDGDTSTNDTVLLMASGRLGGAPMSGGPDDADFERALAAVCAELAWRIVRDGEGATRVMDVRVRGAASSKQARLAARAVATSPLVKTALHGGDPNWGRVLAAVGRSGARFSARRISLCAGAVAMVAGGEPAAYRERDAARVFARECVPLTIDLGVGTAAARVLSSDLGHDYVAMNADYRS